MTMFRKPQVNQWYRHLDKGYRFQVIALDDDADTVELQHFDGDVEELDLEDWYKLDVEPIAQPENWTGPTDAINYDDLDYTDSGMTREEWEAPLREDAPTDEDDDPRRSGLSKRAGTRERRDRR